MKPEYDIINALNLAWFISANTYYYSKKLISIY